MPINRIGLGVHRQQSFVDYVGDGVWRIWVIFNNNATAGTYYELHPDGSMDLVIDNGNMIEEQVNVRQADTTER